MRKKSIILLGLALYILSAALTFNMMSGGKSFEISESELGIACVTAAYPAATRGLEKREAAGESIGEIITKENIETGDMSTNVQTPEQEKPVTVVDTQNSENPSPATANVDYEKPLVIIYHTHATEAYQPISEGNYRTREEAGSVREVGNVLTDELEKLGVSVVHDKTLHDAESYNQSYSRSLDTVKSLMAKYPSAVFVIDLHRDAASYTGNVGKTVLVNGETVAAYSLVVGEGNDNAGSLNIFANTVNSKAEELYPGYGGKIISKAYKYNEYVSDYALLLEIGNNENNIREAKASAKYFAHVLAAVIQDMT